ncbi:xylulokinase [Carnobacterium gallinarum]|uniref:xylulokinase n=1 Tax=Carnobacterium gallinarum TaxID=2749 RepID=UPI0005548CB6|nr:xylulokinase [Carnobacterium gallinarum]
MEYVVGIDLGTSSLKGILVNPEGSILATASASYAVETTQVGYSEQHPEIWIEATKKVITQLIQEVPTILDYLVGISFSGQMHSLVLLNQENQPLRKAILWNDVRTTSQCERVMSEFGEELLAITKNRALEGFTLPKLLWVKENEPEIWQQAAHFLLPKDYLGFWLTGKQHMDYSDAAGTLLLDVVQQQWSMEIADQFAIPAKLFPKLVASNEKIGELRTELATEFGFKQRISVFAGGADNACGALGAGIIAEGVGMCSIGTSGVFLSYEASGEKEYQGQLHIFNHTVTDSFYSMGVTLSAGHSLTWFKETFAENQSYEELLTGIEDLPIGSAGLLFTPYIVGERTPYVDSQIRGSFIGIDTNHTKKHFAKAVLEGITFSLKDSQQLMEMYANRQFKRIVSVGGGAKNAAWLQMQADIFNATIMTLTAEEGPAMGAAMLAAMGSGWFSSFEACAAAFVSYQKEYQPIAANVAAYQKVYSSYQKVYPATKIVVDN